MKTKPSIIIIFLSVLLLWNCTEKQAEIPLSGLIRINQLGYLPDAGKQFVVADTTANVFEVIETDGKKIFEGVLSSSTFWEPSGEYLKTGDFSGVVDTGRYYIVVTGTGRSYAFTIQDTLYKEAYRSCIKSYYYARASMEILPEHAGRYSRPTAHPDTLCYFHPSTGKDTLQTLSSPGGWYDAGDYNKYIVNGGVTNATLMALYEIYPDAVPDNALNIPESGNGISDLLNEVKYELDWFLTMQNDDGGVYFKLTTKNFEPFIPPREANSKRFIMKKTTASTLNFCANMAQAARVYSEADPDFAGKTLKAAVKAWQWAINNPEVYYSNPEDVHTGEYEDTQLDEEFFWAATELYITTRQEIYSQHMDQYKQKFRFVEGESWRNYAGCLAYFSLYANGYANSYNDLTNYIIDEADRLLSNRAGSPYGTHQYHYEWASNCDIANQAMIFAYSYLISKNKKYMAAILQSLDYLFGKNATGYSFITGFGENATSNPHNRMIETDGIQDPVPGYLAGGPNAYKQDAESLQSNGFSYPSDKPAKCYIDNVLSFASNETCINWNAPLVFVLGVLEKNSIFLQPEQ